MDEINDIEIELSGAEVVCLKWLTHNGPNVNKIGAIVLTGIHTLLRDVPILTQDQWNERQGSFQFPTVVLGWLKERIQETFDTTGVPAQIAIAMYALENRLTNGQN